MPLRVRTGRFLAAGVTLLLCGLSILWAWRTYRKPAVVAEVHVTASGIEVINREQQAWPEMTVHVESTSGGGQYSFHVSSAIPTGRSTLIAFEAFECGQKRFDPARQRVASVRLAVPQHALTRFEFVETELVGRGKEPTVVAFPVGNPLNSGLPGTKTLSLVVAAFFNKCRMTSWLGHPILIAPCKMRCSSACGILPANTVREKLWQDISALVQQN